jgi:hypothetical protein
MSFIKKVLVVSMLPFNQEEQSSKKKPPYIGLSQSISPRINMVRKGMKISYHL